MDKKIKDFLASKHLLALSVIENDGTYSASCYYAFCEKNLSLCFKSDENSKHIQFAKKNKKVSAIITKDSKNLALLQGAQIQAFFREANVLEKDLYYKRFPFAKLGSGSVFALDICFAKYTNNKLLLKEKLTYKKE